MGLPKLERPATYDGSKGTLLSPVLEQIGKSVANLTEWLNLDAPDTVLECHREYVNAGSMVIQTNSFNGNRLRLAKYGLGGRVREVNRSAAEIARKAAGDEISVAGSVGPSGKLLMMNEVTEGELREVFAEQAEGLAEGGIDFFHVETMTDVNEAVAAVEGIRRASDLPIAVTLSFDSGNPEAGLRTMMGVTPAHLAEKGRELGLFAIGGNCGKGLEGYQAIVQQFKVAWPDANIIMKLNAGSPKMVEGKVSYDATPEQAAEYALWCADCGVKLIGLCCGSRPDHIEAIANALRQRA